MSKIALNSHFKNLIYQLVISISVWTLVIFIYFLIRFLGNSSDIFWADEFRDFFDFGIVTGLILGSINWLSNIVIDYTGLKKKSYYVLILFNLFVIIYAVALVLLFLGFFLVANNKIELTGLWDYYFQTFGNLGTLSLVIILIASSILLSLIRNMRFMIGSRVLMNLLIGKYHHPRKENMIFMFLDMKSSTTIAEKIGHVKFSQLIQDCFYDINESVIKFNAQIYKYIGDEAILSWEMDKVSRPDYLGLFFHYDQKLNSRSNYYIEKYGVVPEFKAGINAGEVTTLEVGVIKKEIAHLSDVLNTAARIQGLCNKMNAKILVSETIKNLPVDQHDFKFEFKDSLQLRGKEEKVKIFEVFVESFNNI